MLKEIVSRVEGRDGRKGKCQGVAPRFVAWETQGKGGVITQMRSIEEGLWGDNEIK